MLAIDDRHVYPERASGQGRIAKSFSGTLQSVGVHLIGLDEGTMNLCHEVDELEIHGGYGQVQGASREQGEKIITTVADFLSRIVDELRRIELPLA